jgi:hypothetical protein
VLKDTPNDTIRNLVVHQGKAEDVWRPLPILMVEEEQGRSDSSLARLNINSLPAMNNSQSGFGM